MKYLFLLELSIGLHFILVFIFHLQYTSHYQYQLCSYELNRKRQSQDDQYVNLESQEFGICMKLWLTNNSVLVWLKKHTVTLILKTKLKIIFYSPTGRLVEVSSAHTHTHTHVFLQLTITLTFCTTNVSHLKYLLNDYKKNYISWEFSRDLTK